MLSAFAGHLGLDGQSALRLASGFGGGMGRMAGTCGAVTGAFLLLGLKYGRASPTREAKEEIYSRIREFADRFKARNGSLTCKDLLGCDISTTEGHELAREKNLVATTCLKFVRDAVEILDEMLGRVRAG